MPVRIANDLPARKTLAEENIFVMTTDRARAPGYPAPPHSRPRSNTHEDRHRNAASPLLGNSPLQVDVSFVRMEQPRIEEHSDRAPRTHSTSRSIESCTERFDGLIITGAPVETLEFEEVDYWPELVGAHGLVAQQRMVDPPHLLGGPGKSLPSFRYQEISPPGEDVRAFPPSGARSERAHLTGLRRGIPRPALPAHRGQARRHRARARSETARRFGGGRSLHSRERRRPHGLRDGPSRIRSPHAQSRVDRDIGRGLPIGVPANYFPADDPGLPLS